jgi:hypothetical protein
MRHVDQSKPALAKDYGESGYSGAVLDAEKGRNGEELLCLPDPDSSKRSSLVFSKLQSITENDKGRLNKQSELRQSP